MGSGCLRKVVKGNAQWGRVCAAQFNWVTVCATCGQSDYTTILRCSIFAKKNYVGGGSEGWQKPLNWEIQPNILQQIEDLLSCLVSSHYLHKTFV